VPVDPSVLEIAIAEARFSRLSGTFALDPHNKDLSRQLSMAESDLRASIREALQRNISWADIAKHGLDMSEDEAKMRYLDLS
jgi:hypothetical protein